MEQTPNSEPKQSDVSKTPNSEPKQSDVSKIAESKQSRLSITIPRRGTEPIPLFPSPTSPGSSLTPPITLRPSIGGYVRSVNRRGNTYMIRDSLPSDDDPVETDGVGNMIEDLYSETINMSSSAGGKATTFKVLYILATIIFIVGGVVTGILSIQDYETEITKYCVAVIGFFIAGIQTLMMTFSIEKRGVLLKDVSVKLRKIARQVRALRNIEMSPKDKLQRLEQYYAEVDDFDLSMYDNSVTSNSVGKETRINQRHDSDVSDSLKRSNTVIIGQSTKRSDKVQSDVKGEFPILNEIKTNHD